MKSRRGRGLRASSGLTGLQSRTVTVQRDRTSKVHTEWEVRVGAVRAVYTPAHEEGPTSQHNHSIVTHICRLRRYS